MMWEIVGSLSMVSPGLIRVDFRRGNPTCGISLHGSLQCEAVHNYSKTPDLTLFIQKICLHVGLSVFGVQGKGGQL